MRRRRRTAAAPAVLAALAALAMGAASPAPGAADDPLRLARQGALTDTVGAVGTRAPQIRTAVNRLRTTHRIQLFVAYVSDFAGRTPQDWANATAVRNGLGRKDVLLAVAIRDRRYAVSADQDSGLTQAQLDEVSGAAVEPALRVSDWAGAAIGAANGYDAVLSGRRAPAPAITPGTGGPRAAPDPDADDDSNDLWIPVVAGAAAAAAGAYVFRRRRTRRPGDRRAGSAPTGQVRGWGAKRPTPLTPLPELDAQAHHLLVATDDAVRTSQEDTDCAAAQRGEEAARPFGEAVEYARGELTAAFRLRQQLDDAYPQDDETRRQLLDEILSRCTQANRRLDAESAAFDRLRETAANAPLMLERAEAVAATLPGRIAAAETALGPPSQRYADAASAPVAGNAAEARDRLEFARAALDRARAAIAADQARAAAFVRAAEGALGQAAVLTDSVTRRERELREADTALRGALAETEADLSEARDLLASTGTDTATGTGLRDRIAAADTVLDEVGKELAAGRYDPLAALRRVAAATAALHTALNTARDESPAGPRDLESAERRARALLDRSLLTARSQVAAARDLITTHRGAIGSRARTRLTEAERRLRQAESPAGAAHAAAALEHAGTADLLARDAQESARRDLDDYVGHGGYEDGEMAGLGGAVLGGILLGGDPGGPGSFGGGETRGRIGGGGRF